MNVDFNEWLLYCHAFRQQTFRSPPDVGLHEKRYEMKNTVLAQRHDLLHWELDT